MGLNLRLSYKQGDEAEILYEAEGRQAFAYVRQWVESKGENIEFYGKDIRLTEQDVQELICRAVQQYLDDYDNCIDIFNDCLRTTPTWYYMEFLQRLLMIKAIDDYHDYYLECDW